MLRNAKGLTSTVPKNQSELLERIKTLEEEVSVLQQSEAALLTSEAKWRTILLNFPDIVAIVDSDLKLQYLNRTIPELNVEGMIGTSVLDYILPAHHDLLTERNNHVFETGEDVQFETEGIGTNGTTAWYISRLGPFVVDGIVQSVIHVVTDVTEQKHIEETARTNERRFRDLVEHAPLCIFEVDIAYQPPKILMANRQAELIYGWPSAQFSSLPLGHIFSPQSDNSADNLVECASLGKPVKFESEHIRNNGVTFPVRISATPEIVDGNQRMIVIVEDISAERKRRSEIDALDEERRRIAHEIHDGLAQNLAALRLQAAVWHDLLVSDPEKIHDEIEHLLAALKSYIRDVRRSIFALRPISLDELSFFPALNHFLTLFDQYYPVQARLNVLGREDHLPPHLELPLFRIIQEALNNVGQHARANTVSTVLDLSVHDKVELTISDNGIGFDTIAAEKLVHAEHLGLKSMRERVESFGGAFFIHSEKGSGTEIRVVFPIQI